MATSPNPGPAAFRMQNDPGIPDACCCWRGVRRCLWRRVPTGRRLLETGACEDRPQLISRDWHEAGHLSRTMRRKVLVFHFPDWSAPHISPVEIAARLPDHFPYDFHYQTPQCRPLACPLRGAPLSSRICRPWDGAKFTEYSDARRCGLRPGREPSLSADARQARVVTTGRALVMGGGRLCQCPFIA